jgi:hypothetical protein
LLRILLSTLMTSALSLPLACNRDERPSTPRDRADRSGMPKLDDGPSLASQAPEVAPTAPPPSTTPADQRSPQPAAPPAPRTQDDPISEMDAPRNNSIGEMQGGDPITHEPKRPAKRPD